MITSIRRAGFVRVARSGVLIGVLFVAASAQPATNHSLPRVGTIKDYPATGLMTGCGNVYVYKVADADSSTANYVFLSRGDGSHAWMNLNGRDVRLRKTKSGAGAKRLRSDSYRYGSVHITVETKPFTPRAGRPEHMFKMKITLRRGGAVRVVHAIGDADC
ncbi:MAG TPA: hypothetical protein VIT19_12055 [Pyrinomonadaceae bacterium]